MEEEGLEGWERWRNHGSPSPPLHLHCYQKQLCQHNADRVFTAHASPEAVHVLLQVHMRTAACPEAGDGQRGATAVPESELTQMNRNSLVQDESLP